MANEIVQKILSSESATINSEPNNSELTTPWRELVNAESDQNSTNIEHIFMSQSPIYLAVLETFIIIEIIMTATELIIWIAAAIKMPKWRRNYRNQMLLQLSLARFIKRLFFLFQYFFQHHIISTISNADVVLNSFQMYIDFVIVTLVIVFIKHMYDSLIVVMLKVSQSSLNKILTCAWLVPAPISAVWTGIIIGQVLDKWMVYFLICCLFRWPMMVLGTSFYVIILYRVLSDKIRKFARSLTVSTFLLCLVTNFYLFSKDVIELWCLRSLLALLISYLSGFLLNFLILTFYIILITISLNHRASCRSLPDYNLADV